MVLSYKLWIVVEDGCDNPAYDFGAQAKKALSNENAGFDLITAETWQGQTVHLLNLSVRAMMTCRETGEGVHYWLAPRSSIYKTGYIMANSMGVIDRSYRGVLKAPVACVGGAGAAGFSKGDRHFQILAPDMGWIAEVERVSALPETSRGDSGFGSTGR
jgi:dUTPase